MNVFAMVRKALKAGGYDGLWNECGECACSLDHLAPCGEMRQDCEAGVKGPCDPETCAADGECEWHIVPAKEKKK
jgi:hypothetical protein